MQIKIFGHRDVIILTVVSYVLYTAVSIVMDSEMQPYDHWLSDFIVDVGFCVVFSVVSLALSHYIFRIIGFNADCSWSFIYCCILLLLNSMIAVIMDGVFNVMSDNPGRPRFEAHGIYEYAMLVTIVSGIYLGIIAIRLRIISGGL